MFIAKAGEKLFLFQQCCIFEFGINEIDHSSPVLALKPTMGIHGLSKLLADQAPKCISESPIGSYFGRKVAIDASMSIYQFLIAVRSEGNVLMSELGETTSHLMGMFYRTIRMIENGIKPVYVFDGKPPELKSHEVR